MIQVRKARHTRGTKLEVTFSDGTTGVVDLRAELGSERSLAAVKSMLAKVKIEGGSPFFEAAPDAHFAPSWYYARAHGLPVPSTHAEAQANEAAVTLRQLRERQGLNQTQAAQLADITQPEVVRIEKQGDMRLSTLASYLGALGWQLEIGVRRGSECVELGPFTISRSAAKRQDPRRAKPHRPRAAAAPSAASHSPRGKTKGTPKRRAASAP